MSIFGDMDSEELEKIPDNPWNVPNNWYHVFIEKAWESEKDGVSHANFRFKIDDMDNDYHGMPLSRRFQVFPGQKFVELSADEQRELIRLKEFLIKGCDLSNQDLPTVRYEELQGTELWVKAVNSKSKDGREFTNVNDYLSMRLAEERNISTDNTSKSMGL